MKCAVVVSLVVCVLGSVSQCVAQPSASKGVIGVKKGDVLVEVQQIPLESFGAPAEIEHPEQWSTWLIRLTNRRRLPIMVQGGWRIDFPPPLSGEPIKPQDRAANLDYSNWRLCDGEDKIVGKVAHELKTAVDEKGKSIMTPVFDYLLESKGPLASPDYALRGPPEPMTIPKANWLDSLFRHGGQTRGNRRLPRWVLPPSDPDVSKPPVMPSPALWPGESTWGYLVFYQSTKTRSNVLIPKGYFGKGATWARVVNPELASELTRPQEEAEAEAAPTREDAIQRWLREHGYTTEQGET